MRKSDIYVIQGEDYKEMAARILQAADLAADIGDRKKRPYSQFRETQISHAWPAQADRAF